MLYSRTKETGCHLVLTFMHKCFFKYATPLVHLADVTVEKKSSPVTAAYKTATLGYLLYLVAALLCIFGACSRSFLCVTSMPETKATSSKKVCKPTRWKVIISSMSWYLIVFSVADTHEKVKLFQQKDGSYHLFMLSNVFLSNS